MDTMSSAEFRKTYAKLTRAVSVTANGHPIGVWTPVPTTIVSFAPNASPADVERERERFSTRPFTPVPKRGTRG